MKCSGRGIDDLLQLAGEVGLAGKCGATHYRRRRCFRPTLAGSLGGGKLFQYRAPKRIDIGVFPSTLLDTPPRRTCVVQNRPWQKKTII
jgi:hypothetical protein